MEGPIPVFLTYLDLPNGLEGGSTANYFFWIFMLNKVCTAKREAILKVAIIACDQIRISEDLTFLVLLNSRFVKRKLLCIYQNLL